MILRQLPPRRRGGGMGEPSAHQARLRRFAAECSAAAHGDPLPVHFLWGFFDDGSLPGEYDEYLSCWFETNPDLDYVLHGPQAARDHIGVSFPAWLPRWHRYPKGIQRCDIYRYMLMKSVGGVYADLDAYPLTSLRQLMDNHPRDNVFLVVEAVRASPWKRTRPARYAFDDASASLAPVCIGNYFFISRAPGHPFWDDVLETAVRRASFDVEQQGDIIFTTGPEVLSETWAKCGHRYDDVHIIQPVDVHRLIRHRCHGGWRTFYPAPVPNEGTRENDAR